MSIIVVMTMLGAQTPTDTLPEVELEAPTAPDELQRARDLQVAIQELLAIYRRIDGLREVHITVEERILELSGTALSQDDRLQAAELAADIPGIIWVDNRIEVESDLRKRMSPAMDRLREKADTALRYFPSLVIGLLMIAASFFVAYLAGKWLLPPRKADRNPFARNLLRQTLRAVIGLTGVLLALELMAATALVGAVLGAAGVAGIAVGFAFRDIVENYLAGVLLSLRQPFSHNDFVELGGQEGRIVRLTGRETILMTVDGNHVRIPNATVFKSVMTNFTRNPRRRFVVKVGVDPAEPLQKVVETGRAILADLPGTLESPGVSARIHELGDSSVDVRFSGWVDQSTADFGKVRSEAMKAIKEGFEAMGIATPPPEYGIRILGDAASRAEEPAPPSPRPAPTGPPGEPPADISPDTTIEEEIAREMRDSDEEDLLQPPVPDQRSE